MYYLVYLEIHMEAKQKNRRVADIIKLKYYTFFTEVLRDSETTYSFFQKDKPYFSHLLTSNYLLVLMLSIMLGFEHRDNQLVNMALICVIDIVVELLDVVPNWRRRQLLILDEIIWIIYGNKELWYMQVYIQVFETDQPKEISMNDLMDEYLLIKQHYGVEVIEFHILALKQNKLNKSQYLRSLGQHAAIISDDK